MKRNFCTIFVLRALLSFVVLLWGASCNQKQQTNDLDSNIKQERKSIGFYMNPSGISDGVYDPLTSSYYKILPPDKFSNQNYRFKVRAIYSSRYDIWLKWITPSGKNMYQKLTPKRDYSEFTLTLRLKERGVYTYCLFVSKNNGTYPCIQKRSMHLRV